MADNAKAGGDAQITFKVKAASETAHSITMLESATVLELKTTLATAEFENVPVERQRLIYSGRVMKNDDTLASYKVKPNNTIHMVKSAASNPSQSTSTPAQAIPSSMASGTANNPLSGITGARYAGHQINLPGLDMFGPDGGMGPPMDEERLQHMMSDPNVQQSMHEALNNPDFINMLIDSNPLLRNVPNAREIITSPFMRQMMSNPQMISEAMRMQRSASGGGSSFPAPGATDTTPEGAATYGGAAGQANNHDGQQGQGQGPFMNPFERVMGSGASMGQLLQNLNSMGANPEVAPNTVAPNTAQTGSTATPGQDTMGGNAGAAQAHWAGQDQHPANPFAALFPPAQGTSPANLFGANPGQFQQMMQMFGGAGSGASPSQADSQPPEERYAEQLRQLNDMGFYNFDRNVAALRRSGGSVQGAIEHLLLSATD